MPIPVTPKEPGDALMGVRGEQIVLIDGDDLGTGGGGTGADGLSAYQIAVNNGFVGTEQEWLDSLEGRSAYQAAVDQGFVGTEGQWVLSLKGEVGESAYQAAVDGGFVGDKPTWIASLNGSDGKSAYQSALDTGFVGTESAWIESLKGDPGADSTVPGPEGKSAYQSAVDGGFVGTEQEWIDSIEGVKGDPGDDAYEVAVAAGFVGTRAEWLSSLIGPPGNDGADSTVPGPDGKSAYQVAVDNGFVGTEQEWLDSLVGPPGDSGGGVAGPPGLGVGYDVTLEILPEDGSDLRPAIMRCIADGRLSLGVPAGIYTVSNKIPYPTGLRFSGVGEAETIIDAPNGLFYNPDQDPVTPSLSGRRSIYLSGLQVRGANTVGVYGLEGPFGGQVDNAEFRDFDRGIANGAAYLSRYINVDFDDCNIGLSIADANGCRIDDCWASAQCQKAISMNTEVPQSVGTNNGTPMIITGNNFNLGNAFSNNTCCVLRGNIFMVGNYFEDFTTNGTISNNTFVELEVGRFDDMAFTFKHNEMNGQGEADVGIRIYGTSNLDHVANAEISHNRFLGFRVGAIAFGTVANPEYNRVSKVKIHSNGYGLVAGAVEVFNHNPWAKYRRMGSMGHSSSVAVSGATWVTLPITQNIEFDNANLAVGSNVIRWRDEEIVKVTARIFPRGEVQISLDGVSVYESPDGVIDTYVNMANNLDLQLKARNGTTCTFSSITVESKHDGNQ